MKFKVKHLGVSSGNVSIVVMDDEDAFACGINPGDRVKVSTLKKDGIPNELGIVAIADLATSTNLIKRGEVGFYDETMHKLKLKNEAVEIDITLSSRPKSFDAIKKKIKGINLTTTEINEIINDCTDGNLLPIEMAAFITALQIQDASDQEIVDLTNAMANSGEVLDFGPDVYDKHSTGGVPGNKVTLIIVPIIAAAGLFIPKTSTRAITSPSGTADSMEVLAPVAFAKERVIEILKNERVGILWGGALDLAPADNALIHIEKPLNMDPFCLMIASIICKKMAMGVKKMVLDIPCGKGTKFPTPEDGKKYAIRFKEISKSVGIETICLLTSASQPIGHAVGPALEAIEAMKLLNDPMKGSTSLRNKSVELAGILLEMAGKAPEGRGKDLALEILTSGKALAAMKRIIRTQGGNPDIKIEDIEVGPFMFEAKATEDSIVTGVENEYVNKIAKIAGCPGSKKSGIEIIHKIGQKFKKGEVIFRIYSDNEKRLQDAVEFYNSHLPQITGGMTIEKI